jgi:arylsulfatase A-like enzyme
LGEEDIQFLIDSYDSEIYYADSHVKRVFQHLKENNLWDNTIIIFTADHGEEFSDHKSLAHGKTLYNELLHVPLIIRNPRLSPREVEMQVRVIDIAPTILDALDIPIPDSFQGTSLNPLMTGQKFNPDATVYGEDIHYFEEQVKYFNGEKKSIQTGGWKLIANTTDTGDCIEFELYNINEDPGEKKNVLLENPGVAAVLRKQLMEWANTTSNTSESKTVILTEELLEQLKSLGYAT